MQKVGSGLKASLYKGVNLPRLVFTKTYGSTPHQTVRLFFGFLTDQTTPLRLVVSRLMKLRAIRRSIRCAPRNIWNAVATILASMVFLQMAGS